MTPTPEMERLAREKAEEAASTVPSNREAAFAIAYGAALAAIMETTERADAVDILSEHFPSGIRGLYDQTACGARVQTYVGTDCQCGWVTAATDEQEVRQKWADHVLAALKARGVE